MRYSTSRLLAGLTFGLLFGAATSEAAPDPSRPTATVRRHLVYFRDKAGTPFTVSQPQAYLSQRAVQRRQRQSIAVQPRDLPVSPAYASQVKAVPGVRLWYTSRWFNAAVVECDSASLARLQALPFVRSATTLNRSASVRKTPAPAPRIAPTVAARGPRLPAYGEAFWQADMIGAVSMHQAGYRGEGLQIAVLDAGFPGVDQISAFRSMFSEGRLLSTFDFVDKDRTVFEKNSHGTQTLSTLAGNQDGVFIGTAPKASYHLLLTEDVRSEHPMEEVNWLLAAEYADSAGVDIISSSLGYTTFDFPSRSYTYNDMNGRTAISTRAATVAARVGMLVVNSAGNDGGSSWRHIGAPADADSIMSVGAVDSLQSYIFFSSVGPTADARIKPNMAAQGFMSAYISPAGFVGRGSGTSYACPIMAGMVAGFWQANPTLSAQQVIQALQRSGTRATNPNNEVGYGVPNFVTAYNLLNPGSPLSSARARKATDGLSIFPNPAGRELSLYLPEAYRRRPLQIRVTDSRGAVVAAQELKPVTSDQVALQIGALKAGLYTCTVLGGSDLPPRTVRFEQQ